MNNDRFEKDYHKMRSKLKNTPQKLKQHLNIGSQIVDSQYNELEIRFTAIHSNVKALYNSCNKYKLSLHSFFYNSLKTLDCFQHILENVIIMENPELPEPSTHLSNSSKLKTTEILQNFYDKTGLPIFDKKQIDLKRLNNHFQIVAYKVEKDLEFFNKNVQQPLLTLETICGNISQAISKREIASTELSALNDKRDKYTHLFENPSKVMTAKQEIDRMKCEKKITNAKAKYCILNDILKTQLERFFEIFNSFLNEWFNSYYFTTYRISYALYNSSLKNPEFQKIGFNNKFDLQQSILEPPTADEIVNQFHDIHNTVVEEVNKLNIVNFLNFYKYITESGKNSYYEY